MFNIEENFINHDWAKKGFRHLCSKAKLLPLTGICNRPFNKKNDVKAWKSK